MIILLTFFFEIAILFFFARLLSKTISRLFFKVSKSESITVHIFSFIFLPGVVVHELSHLIAAALLFVPVGDMEFMPVQTKEGLKLGSVSIAKTDPLRRAIIGVAPVLVGLTIISGLLLFFFANPTDIFKTDLWKIVLMLLALFEITNTMFSSKKDMEGTIELAVVLVVLCILLYALGFRLPEVFVQRLFNGQVLLLLQKVAMLLALPILLDSIVYAGLSLLIRER